DQRAVGQLHRIPRAPLEPVDEIVLLGAGRSQDESLQRAHAELTLAAPPAFRPPMGAGRNLVNLRRLTRRRLDAQAGDSTGGADAARARRVRRRAWLLLGDLPPHRFL